MSDHLSNDDDERCCYVFGKVTQLAEVPGVISKEIPTRSSQSKEVDLICTAPQGEKERLFATHFRDMIAVLLIDDNQPQL